MNSLPLMPSTPTRLACRPGRGHGPHRARYTAGPTEVATGVTAGEIVAEDAGTRATPGAGARGTRVTGDVTAGRWTTNESTGTRAGEAPAPGERRESPP